MGKAPTGTTKCCFDGWTVAISRLNVASAEDADEEEQEFDDEDEDDSMAMTLLADLGKALRALDAADPAAGTVTPALNFWGFFFVSFLRVVQLLLSLKKIFLRVGGKEETEDSA